MYYGPMLPGRFLSRPNRFLAWVEIAGREELCHVKNTGRCRELLRPGAAVWCQPHDDPARKTRFSLITVRKGDYLINMDSQAPNAAAGEWLRGGGLGPLTEVRAEQRFESARFDFSFLENGRLAFLEVKGVTLEDGGVCRFPDAPTLRGEKHVRELMRAADQGYGAYILFVIQMSPVRWLEPNDKTDPAFGVALREAKKAGVTLLAVDCQVTEDSMELGARVPIQL